MTVELVNTGTDVEEYAAPQNVLSTGSGIPEIAQFEYYALPQFFLSESFADLSQFGAADLATSAPPAPGRLWLPTASTSATSRSTEPPSRRPSWP